MSRFSIRANKRPWLIKYIKRLFPKVFFPGTSKYWERRYKIGGNSGEGSYGKLAEFKAQWLNQFVKENRIASVIELGCGDGHQLSLACYPSYIGVDISAAAIKLCEERFRGDSTKVFHQLASFPPATAKLAISLDVIYHLVEDELFCEYLNRLFDIAEEYVVIYSCDEDASDHFVGTHVKPRKFTVWIAKNRPEWVLIAVSKNALPYTGDYKTGSWSDFYVYKRR